jgi:hypothetical protein
MRNLYTIVDNIAVIFVKHKGKICEAVIETEDVERVKEFPGRWYYSSGYIIGQYIEGGKIVTVQMSRWIMNTPPGMEAHHVNTITTDNRRCNLKNVTKGEHVLYMRKENITGRRARRLA